MSGANKTNGRTNSLTSAWTLSAGKYFFYCILALLFAALLIVRIQVLFAHEATETLPDSIGVTADVSGVVVDDPDVRASSAHVTVSVEKIDGVSASGKLLALLPLGTDVSYGDRVWVHGRVQAPQSFETNSGRTFDYPQYLRVRGISAVMQYAALEDAKQGSWSIKKVLFNIKHAFERAIESVVPQPEAALLEGILLGDRGSFPQELMQIFVIVGLVHVVVLSGSNIAIVADASARVLSPLPKAAATIIGLVMIVLFALMTGGGSATLRAVIMGGIAIVARYLHRPDSALRALAIAAAIMLLYNPLLILDSGFVLSMLATFGLITLSVAVEKRLTFLSIAPHIQSVVATTIAVEIFILPALLYFSGVVSVFSLLVNAVVLPIISVIMLLGFITGVLALVHPMLAILPGVAVMLMLRRIIWIATFVAGLPISHAIVPAFPLWVAVLIYVPLTIGATQIFARSQTN
jgi:competence protein ComEC